VSDAVHAWENSHVEVYSDELVALGNAMEDELVARIAALEAKLTWAMGLNACIEHARAERAEAERDALRDRVRELEQGNLEEGPFGWGMREGGEK